MTVFSNEFTVFCQNVSTFLHPFHTSYENLKRAVSEVKAFDNVRVYVFFMLMHDKDDEINSLSALEYIENNNPAAFDDDGFSLESIVLTGESIEDAEAKLPYYKRFVMSEDVDFKVIRSRELTIAEMGAVPELLQFRYPSENELKKLVSKFYSLTIDTKRDLQVFLDVNCHNGVLPAYEEIPRELIFTREQSKRLLSEE